MRAGPPIVLSQSHSPVSESQVPDTLYTAGGSFLRHYDVIYIEYSYYTSLHSILLSCVLLCSVCFEQTGQHMGANIACEHLLPI